MSLLSFLKGAFVLSHPQGITFHFWEDRSIACTAAASMKHEGISRATLGLSSHSASAPQQLRG